MPKVLITYDLAEYPGRHTQVKAQMVGKGYHDHIINNGQSFPMPNTTLAHPNKTRSQAISDLKTSVSEVAARLETVLVVEYTDLSAEKVN